MFRGRHDHTMDAKGRLKIPTGFRNEILRRSEKPPILTNYKNYLALYPYEDWKVIEQDLAAKSKFEPDVVAYTRFVISGSSECPIDSQGRILVPPPLREHAMIKSKVIVAGVLDCIEIWDAQLFETTKLETMSRLEEIQRSVGESPAS
jgi:MraZ protein